MRFGPVDLAEAAGAVLAHSIGIEGGARLRKGRVLTDADIDALRQSGVQQITVARLDPGDIGENIAAEALARAFVPDEEGQNLKLTPAFTGRVNLLATGPGVVVLDAAAIAAVNRVDPMITIATVPACHQMSEGGMVATIKIISYAVSSKALEAACDLARSAIRLAPPLRRAPRLIVSDIAGGVGDKGWRAIADRVAAFGLDLPAPVIVPHQAEAIAEAVTASGGDMIMILTGSATSDIDDVAPQAVVLAGGSVARFGMPVDPGNLLFIGQREDVPVVGLPGCARSPALNGADWVMSRILCGIEVTGDDIAAMGVGGLLKEIPTRPQPRRGRSPD